MALNISKGNMYNFVTHTWNVIKGECYHDCSYCFMKRWGSQNPIRFDEKELKTNLGKGNFIFVGSSNDMFADNISEEWIKSTIDHCKKYDNKYLFQSKNPARMRQFNLPANSVVCTTIETNRWYPEVMNNSPHPKERINGIKSLNYPKYINIEPIMDFDMDELLDMISSCHPEQVSIGANSGNVKLPEPSEEKVASLIEELGIFSSVEKSNLKRLLCTQSKQVIQIA